MAPASPNDIVCRCPVFPLLQLPAAGTLPASHGELPRWDVADLPAPPPFNARNLFKIIGPGAIMVATSIGGGEWLVGPAAAVKYRPRSS